LVTDVLAADLIAVAFGDTRARVRYIGVDAPALNEPFGPAALARNDTLVADQIVFLEADAVDRDADGALLRYVFLPGDLLVNEDLIRSGYARFAASPGNTRYEYTLRNAQVSAMVNGVGQWATPTPTPLPTPISLVTATPTPTLYVVYGSDGLGLARADWEARHAATGATILGGPAQGTVYDGVFDVVFVDGNVAWIDRRWPAAGGTTLSEAESLAASLLPLDRQFVRTYYPPELPGAMVSLYYSPSLAGRFSPEIWGEDLPGTLAVVKLVEGESVARVIVLARDPVALVKQLGG
jgi:hypothetical protein